MLAGPRKVCMLKIAKTATVILAAMSAIVAVAQRSQGRPDRKPSPSSNATSAPGTQGGSPAASSSQQFVTSENSFRANSKNNLSPSDPPATPQEPIVRPATAVQTVPVTSPVVVALTSDGSAVQVPAAQPDLGSSPSPESTTTVLYAHGQLTVISQNASLGTLLKLISSKTGAVIDLSPELQNEPVIAQIGPSPVREVLTGLLDSPKIDYIIMGAPDTAGNVERIVVRTRESFARTALAAGRPSQPRRQDAEAKLDENGHPAAIAATPQAPLSPEQLMENWKKIREEKRLAEIEQQRQDRENEKNQVQVEPPPQPEPTPQPEPQPDNPPAENPPLK
jgi:hypothetical protein